MQTSKGGCVVSRYGGNVFSCAAAVCYYLDGMDDSFHFIAQRGFYNLLLCSWWPSRVLWRRWWQISPRGRTRQQKMLATTPFCMTAQTEVTYRLVNQEKQWKDFTRKCLLTTDFSSLTFSVILVAAASCFGIFFNSKLDGWGWKEFWFFLESLFRPHYKQRES